MLQVAMISVHTCPLARLGARETGGMNVYIRELSRHLGRRGVSVDVFTRRQDCDTADVVEFGENARVIHLEAGPRRPMDKYTVLEHLPQFAWGLSSFAEREGKRYHLLHSHYWLSGRVSIAFADRWRVPLVTMFHTLGRLKNQVSTNGHEREQSTRMQIERQAMTASDLVVAASPTDMEHMVAYYGAPASRIHVVPGGVDTTLFHAIPQELARGQVGMGSGPQLLFIGRLQPLKGIDLLLRAFAALLSRWGAGPKPHLTVVGGRNLADESDPEAMEFGRLRGLAASLGVEDQVTFRGAVPHHVLPAYYAAADVVVVPSLYESFGLVALEAMACGAPVVASRVGGLQWTVRHRETGFLVAQRSPEAFASAIGAVLADENLRSRMSTAATRVAGRYSWVEVSDRILRIYDELAGVRKARVACCALSVER